MHMGGRMIFADGCFALDKTTEVELYNHMREASLVDDIGRSLSYPPHERCVEIAVDLGAGDASCTVYGSDLTHEYVSINADYRS